MRGRGPVVALNTSTSRAWGWEPLPEEGPPAACSLVNHSGLLPCPSQTCAWGPLFPSRLNRETGCTRPEVGPQLESEALEVRVCLG